MSQKDRKKCNSWSVLWDAQSRTQRFKAELSTKNLAEILLLIIQAYCRAAGCAGLAIKPCIYRSWALACVEEHARYNMTFGSKFFSIQFFTLLLNFKSIQYADTYYEKQMSVIIVHRMHANLKIKQQKYAMKLIVD